MRRAEFESRAPHHSMIADMFTDVLLGVIACLIVFLVVGAWLLTKL